MPEYTITGVDGVVWEFPGTPSHGLKYVHGLGGAPFEMDDVTSVGQAGVTFVARDDKPNVIEVGAHIRSEVAGEAAVEVLTDWRKSLGRANAVGDRLVTFECVDSGRFQQCRLTEINDMDVERMRYARWVLEELKLRSDESWWRSEPVDKTFTTFPASLVSKGDVASWASMKLTGPITNPVVGINGNTVALPSLTAGQWLEIDSDPDWWTVKDQTGTDRTWNVGERWYVEKDGQIKPGTNTITLTGSGTSSETSLQVVAPQLFYRAIG